MTREVKRYEQVQEAEAELIFTNGCIVKMSLVDAGLGMGIAIGHEKKKGYTGGRINEEEARKLKHVIDTFLYNSEHK